MNDDGGYNAPVSDPATGQQRKTNVIGYADFDIPVETDPQFWVSRAVHPITMFAMFVLLVLMALMRMYLITGLVASAVIAVGTILAGSVIALRIIIGEITPRVSEVPREVYRPGRWRNVVTMLLFVLLWICPTTRVPERIGFALSRSAMDEMARAVLNASPGTAFPNRRVGLYTARNIYRAEGEVRFDITDVGFGDAVGFLYTTGQLPERIGRDRYIPMNDRWYFHYRSAN